MALGRSDFRVYLHDPEVIVAICRRHGFERVREGHTRLWQWQVLARK